MKILYTRPAVLSTLLSVLFLLGWNSAETAGATIGQPVAHYSFDEADGFTIVDSARGGHGGISASVNRIAGPSGGALSISPGSTVFIPDAPQLNMGTGDLSVSIWIRTSDATSVQRVFDRRIKNGNSVHGYHMYVWDGNIGMQLADGSGTIPRCKWDVGVTQCSNYTTEAFVADGRWHHIAVTVDRDQNGGMHFWVDGQHAGKFNPTNRQGSLNSPGGTPMPLAMDARDSVLDVDEFALYNRVLSVAEINQLRAMGQ